MSGGLLARVAATSASAWVVYIRLAVGLVFPALLGSGRFAKIGIPWPDVLGPFVGSVEIVCGLLILLGLLTRLAAIPLVVTMVVAIVSTKVPILLGRDWLVFQLADLPRYGVFSFLHETRTDWAMLMGVLYLLAVGAGRWSVDAALTKEVRNE